MNASAKMFRSRVRIHQTFSRTFSVFLFFFLCVCVCVCVLVGFFFFFFAIIHKFECNTTSDWPKLHLNLPNIEKSGEQDDERPRRHPHPPPTLPGFSQMLGKTDLMGQ